MSDDDARAMAEALDAIAREAIAKNALRELGLLLQAYVMRREAENRWHDAGHPCEGAESDALAELDDELEHAIDRALAYWLCVNVELITPEDL